MPKPNCFLSLFLCFCLILEQSAFAQTIDLSHYFARTSGQNIPQSEKFRPLHLRYISYDSQANDFKVLLDKGDFFNQQTPKLPNSSTPKLEEATRELMKFFFIGLSLPNEKFWVNLRPDSPDDILDPDLEKTDIGRIFLEADLQLKKDTSGLTSPQTKEGREYWDKLYKKAGELFGSENITIPTLTRPWIVPDEVIIRESPEGAYIYKATLKVMLEEDYLREMKDEGRGTTTNYSFKDPRLKDLNEYSTQLMKETIIPKLTRQINSARRYAPLRQVYYSLILAQWFKQKYGSLGSTRAPGIRAPANNYISLIDSGNLANLTLSQPYDKQTYFQQYQQSFKDGEYNLQEPVYTPMGQSIRRYMSGGIKVNIVSSSCDVTKINVNNGELPLPNFSFVLPAKAEGDFVNPTVSILKKLELHVNMLENIVSSVSSAVDGVANSPPDFIQNMAKQLPRRLKMNGVRLSGGICVDAGTRDGRNIPSIFDLGAEEVFGIDPDKEALDKAVSSGKLDEKHAIYSKLEEWSREAKSIDSIAAFNFIIPLNERDSFLERALELLKTGGTLLISCAEEFTYEDVKKRLQSLNVEISSCGPLFSEYSGDFPNKYYLYVRKIEHRPSPSNTTFNKTKIYSYKIKPLNVEELTFGGVLLSLHDKGIRYIFNLDTGKIETFRDGTPISADTHEFVNSILEAFRNKEFSPQILKKLELHINILESIVSSASSAVENIKVPSSLDNKGGIDLSRINKSIRAESVSSPGVGGLNNLVDADFDLNEELSQLQKLLNAEIVPSADRLNRYARAACSSSLSSPDSKDSALSLVAETFRLQENKAAPAAPELKALAAWLE